LKKTLVVSQCHEDGVSLNPAAGIKSEQRGILRELLIDVQTCSSTGELEWQERLLDGSGMN
jgi:hypothetical protein